MIFSKLSPAVWIVLFFAVLIAKVLFLLFGGGVQSFGFGGGNDADYYAESAENYGEYAVNIWPVLLSALYEIGIYSRKGITYFLFFVSAVVVPYLVIRLAIVGGSLKNNKSLWFSFFFMGIYPALFFYSLDIYRDVFMILVFLLGCFAIRGIAERKSMAQLFLWLAVGFISGFLLYGLRKYLGAAYGVAILYASFCDTNFVKRVEKIKLYYLAIVYFCLVLLGSVLGIFDALTTYRSGFDPGAGGSTFGLQFDSVSLMLPNFVLSWIFQVFGLWPFSGLAITLFFLESLPFIIAFLYTIKNKKFINKFGWSLLIFFVAYNTVWVIGNDNLGTAWRLRIYGYISIFIVFLSVYQEKLRRTGRKI